MRNESLSWIDCVVLNVHKVSVYGVSGAVCIVAIRDFFTLQRWSCLLLVWQLCESISIRVKADQNWPSSLLLPPTVLDLQPI